jgi:hypothetical protein
VVADNCSGATEDLSLLHGAEVVTTAGNTARKAGALNQALRQILPGLRDEDLVLPGYRRLAGPPGGQSRARHRARPVGRAPGPLR